MKLNYIFLLSLLTCMTCAYAAKAVDLKNQPINTLQPYLTTDLKAAPGYLKETRRSTDFNHTTHIHFQQMYKGYRVWGGNAIVHISQSGNTALTTLTSNKNAKINGRLYQDVQKDLSAIPSAEQADLALQTAIKKYLQPFQNKHISQKKTELIVFIDQNNKARWSYLVNFFATSGNDIPASPMMIIDANTQEIYRQWDSIETMTTVSAGGAGGNKKEGEFTYDGLNNNYPMLSMMRDDETNICYEQNAEVTVKNVNTNAIIQFACAAEDPAYNNVYWNGTSEAANGGFNPANDALFVGKVVQEMYEKWYGVPAIHDANGNKAMLNIQIHWAADQAYWYGNDQTMTFGDGVDVFYPLVSVGVGAHEISHGFTQQHSDLTDWYQPSGAINESFSDMAAQAAEFYANGKASWQFGGEVMKGEGSLRYLDDPTKDCNGNPPGTNCSIDNVSEYYVELDMHYASGIFNKAFYLIGSEKGWNDVHKAFDIMVKANEDYWIPDTSFEDAACGVLQAARDYHYDENVVKAAFIGVGINTLDNC